MTEPLRDSARTPLPPSDDADRAARIEELLVSGLDHYFAAEYEHAINIWTRVVFLERDHDRARAYIERARSAIAERQRESEELLQRGVDAYQSGDVATARDLLKRAVDHGAPSDEALLLLDRLDRLEGTGFDAPLYRGPSPIRLSAPAVPPLQRRRPLRWVTIGIAIAVIGATVVVGGARAFAWIVAVPAATPRVAQTVPEPLPIVRPAETLLDRARALYVGGHLYDAMSLLERVDVADPARAEADDLRADIERALLASATAGLTPPARGAAAR
jgi:hypothetical protein